MSGKKTPTESVRKPPGGTGGRVKSSPSSTKKSKIYHFFRDTQLRAPEHRSFSTGEPSYEKSKQSRNGNYGKSGSGGGRNSQPIELHQDEKGAVSF